MKIVFHSRPRPVSVPRSSVMIIDGASTDNAEMDMSRFRTAPQPNMPMYPPPMNPMQNMWAPPGYGVAPEPVPVIPKEHVEEPRALEPWVVRGVRVRTPDGATGVIVETRGATCSVGFVEAREE